MAHEENNFGGGTEFADSDEQKISQMLGGLKRVEAPKDFDFHLKARIAKGRPEEVRPASLFPILKYALPLVLVLFVSAGILLRSSYNTYPEPVVLEPNSSQPSVPTNVVGSVDSVNTTSSSNQLVDNGRKPSIAGSDVAEQQPKVPESGGSRDFPSRPDRPLILPPGGRFDDRTVRVAPTPRNPRGMEQKKYTAQEGLVELGIEADFENGSWSVKSVKANMAGDAIGVKRGDRIIALDGKPINDKTEFDGKVDVRTIRVSRGSETLDLSSETNKPR